MYDGEDGLPEVSRQGAERQQVDVRESVEHLLQTVYGTHHVI